MSDSWTEFGMDYISLACEFLLQLSDDTQNQISKMEHLNVH